MAVIPNPIFTTTKTEKKTNGGHLNASQIPRTHLVISRGEYT